jgi:hypothetical protein
MTPEYSGVTPPALSSTDVEHHLSASLDEFDISFGTFVI